MRTRVPLYILASLLAALWGFGATDAANAQNSSQPNLRIFTDGIARPDGRGSRAFTELARVLAGQGKLRALPVMGYGGVANVNDLLHSRGVEFAILNSDVLAYLDLTKEHPNARQKIRYVTRLFGQKAYLLARGGIVSLDQLAGKMLGLIGPPSATRVTARTILSSLGVKAEIRAQEAGDGGVTPDQVDAVLFLEDDLSKVPPGFFQSGAFHLVAVPVSEKLASVYRPATIREGELPIPGAGEIPTVAVDTLLVTFDWAPTHARHADVARFIDRFFQALPKLRETFPNSIWNEMDVHAPVAGWKRFAYADKAKSTVPAIVPMPIAARPTIEKPSAPVASGQEKPGRPPSGAETDQHAAAAAADILPAESTGQRLRLSIASVPPLTDQSQPGGGLIAELATTVVERASGGGVTVAWSKDRTDQIGAASAKSAESLTAPWETPDCDKPQNLSSEHAALCDGAFLSAPLFQVPIVMVTKADSQFDLESEGSADGRVICVHAGRDLTDLDSGNRNWISNSKVTLRRPETLIDCLSMVERGEADALIASEAESRFAIHRLGLSDVFSMTERPLATRGIHIAVPKNHPGSEALLERINSAIGQLKKSDAYSAMVDKHLPAFMPNETAKVQ